MKLALTTKHIVSSRILLLLLVGLSYFSLLRAESPNGEKAKSFALNFFAKNASQRVKGESVNSPSLIQVYESKAKTKTPIFVYQNSVNGFVLVAQSNNKFAVVGYSPQGEFIKDKVPPFLIALIQQYEDSLQITSEPIQRTINAKAVVAPLLDAKGIALNQYAHENVGDCPTGCVATAFTQIMAYYKFPDKGVGSHCYTHSNYGQLCADFGNTTYNWNNPTDADYKLLSSHVGIAMDMNYCGSIYGSSPLASDYAYTLQKYFKYFTKTRNSTIINELDHGRPVYVSLPGDPIGHAAVVDGYDEDGWYHLNFGWGGSYAGYFPLLNNTFFKVGYKFSTNVSPVYVSMEPSRTNKADSLILVKIHNAFKGETGWDLNTPVQNWKNVDILNERVSGIYIWNDNYNTVCSIPDEIKDLTELSSITIYAHLTGTLTSEISKLTKLKKISIINSKSNTNFNFTIPTNIGNLTDLEYLRIDNSKGTIPSSIGNLTKLKQLYLTDGTLTGSIPAEIGNLTQLDIIDLKNNQLSGVIPASLGNLSNIAILDLTNNQLSAIENGNWNCSKLLWLLLSNNKIEGNLPASFGSFESLKTLELSNNKLLSLPSEMGNLANLTYINLDGNNLTAIPDAWTNLTNLTELSANYNQISQMPTEFSSWKDLRILSINHNQLEYFPQSICELPNVYKIDLSTNKISKFAKNIATLSGSVTELYLQNNNLSDTLPLRIMQDSLILARLDTNKFTYSHIPQASGLKVPLGSQKPISLKKNVVKVMMGDTVKLNIKKLYPYSLSDDSYYWLPASKYPSVSTKEAMETLKIEEDSVLTIIIDEKTIQNQYYCKIFNESSPNYNYKIYYDGSYLTGSVPCLSFINTETVSFVLATDEEIYADKYTDSKIISSSDIQQKLIGDKTVTLVPPIKFRGTIKWQASADAKTWYDLSNSMSQTDLKANFSSVKSDELVLSPKTPAFYRCSIQDVSCEPLYSDTVKVNPFGAVLYDGTLNVSTASQTVKIDSIEVTIPAKLYDKDFRLTIVKLENQPQAPSGAKVMPAYDVTVSFGEVFNAPLQIKLKNIDKKQITKQNILNLKAVYLDKKTHQWITYENSYVSLKDTTMVFETDHLTVISVGWWDSQMGYDKGYERNNIQVFYKEADVKTMNEKYIQTSQSWHVSGVPIYVQDVTEYLHQVMVKLKQDGLPVPDHAFSVYIKKMKDCDGVVGISGMINHYLTINIDIADPVNLRSLLAHEFMHYIQDNYIAANTGNVFWMEAHAHLTDRIVWDENTIPISESDNYLLNNRTSANSIFEFLDTSWDYWDSSILTQNFWGNLNYCYIAGTFLHYMRSYREGEKKLNPITLLKQTAWFGSWRQYLNSYIVNELNSNISDEYENFVKYIFQGKSANFTLIDTEEGANPYYYLNVKAVKNTYNFKPEVSTPQKNNYNFKIPYLASKVVLLQNGASDRPVVVNYKRQFEKDENYKVYVGTFDYNTKKIVYRDISDSTKCNIFLDTRTKETAKYAKNACFLLFINKTNPTATSWNTDFDANFELTAMPVLNIENIALASVSDKSIHTYSDGAVTNFTVSGRIDFSYISNHTDLKFQEIYYASNKSLLSDSSYVATAHFGYHFDQIPVLNEPTAINIFDIEQTITYNFINSSIEIKQKTKTTTKFKEWMELPSKTIMPASAPIITEELQTVRFKNMTDFKPVKLEGIGEAIQYSTLSTSETKANIDKISHSKKTTRYNEQGEISTVESSNYVSTNYSSEGIIADVFIHTK